MKLKEVGNREIYRNNKSLTDGFKKLEGIVNALDKRELPDEIVGQINRETEALNIFEGPKKKILLRIKTTETTILELVRKKLGLIPEKFNTFLWMPIGMAAFGLPLGTLIFAITGNAAFIGLGLPIEMGIGVVLGMGLDKKALKENRVLRIEEIPVEIEKQD